MLRLLVDQIKYAHKITVVSIIAVIFLTFFLKNGNEFLDTLANLKNFWMRLWLLFGSYKSLLWHTASSQIISSNKIKSAL